MRAELIHAIVKGMGDLPDLVPGNYDIDETLTIHVSGSVKRAEDGKYTPTTSIPVKATLALVLHLAGFQRERAMELLVEAMTKALAESKQATPEIEALLADVETANKRVLASIAKLPKAPRKGATTVDTTVEVVEPAVA